MSDMTTFELRQRFQARQSPRRKRSLLAAIVLVAALSATIPSIAGDDERAKNQKFYYQPYNEAEIKAAAKKPLTLNDCIRIALAKNIALRIACGDLSRAEALHAGSYGKFLPVFSVEGAKTNSLEKLFTQNQIEIDDSTEVLVDVTEKNFDNNSTVTGKANLFLPTGATFQFSSDFFRAVQYPFEEPTVKSRDRSYSLNLTQPLLRDAGPTVARSSFLTTGYDRQLEEKNLLNEKLQTVFSVKRAYYLALLQRELIKVNQIALIRDSTLVEASKALIVAKQATRRDVLSAEIRFADDRAALLASKSDYELALDNLKDVAGLPIDMPIKVDSTGLDYAPVNLDEKLLVRQAIENNPGIRNAEISISRSRLQRSLAKNALLPQLDLVASYSSELRTNLVRNRDLSRTGGWQARLNLSYPFLNREAASKAEEAEIAVAQQQDRLLGIQRQITIDVRDVVRGVYSAVEQIKAIQASIKVAEEKLEFSTLMFNLGRASNFDITESQEFLLKAQNQYLRKLVDYHTQLALLENLTGKPIVQ